MTYKMLSEVNSDKLLIKISGRLGGEVSINLYREIKDLIDLYPGKDLVLDFGEVDFIDSTGLGALVAVNSTILRKKRELTLSAVPQNLMNLLKITNLDRILKITNSVNNAK